MTNNNNLLYQLNSICILIVSGILLGALYFQFGLHEAPCPLCLLQRMGMMGVIIALCLNIHFGIRKEHFGVAILASLVGSVYSVRQILLHICPGPGESGGYGTAVFNMHLYTWALVVFLCSIIGCVLFIFYIKDEDKNLQRTPLKIEKFTPFS